MAELACTSEGGDFQILRVSRMGNHKDIPSRIANPEQKLLSDAFGSTAAYGEGRLCFDHLIDGAKILGRTAEHSWRKGDFEDWNDRAVQGHQNACRGFEIRSSRWISVVCFVYLRDE
jgi:hypothetical protein